MKGFVVGVLFLVTFSSNIFAESVNPMRILVNKAIKDVGEIESSIVYKMIENEEAIIILDVREPEQKFDGEIYADDMYAITRGNLEFEVENEINDKNALVITYCLAGNRGALAAQALRRLGYKNATSLKGGLRAWANGGFPIETAMGPMRLIASEKNKR